MNTLTNVRFRCICPNTPDVERPIQASITAVMKYYGYVENTIMLFGTAVHETLENIIKHSNVLARGECVSVSQRGEVLLCEHLQQVFGDEICKTLQFHSDGRRVQYSDGPDSITDLFDPRKPLATAIHIDEDLAIVEILGAGVVSFTPTDREGLPDPTDFENLEKPHGRGLLLMKSFSDGVRMNERGNHVRLYQRGKNCPPAKEQSLTGNGWLLDKEDVPQVRCEDLNWLAGV